jgi:hypothetical protein
MAEEPQPKYELEIVYNVGDSQYKITAFGTHSAFLVPQPKVRRIEITHVPNQPWLKLRLTLEE